MTITTRTPHVVRISLSEHERFGGGDVKDLVRSSFDFLLDRESNTAILQEFGLGVIESNFPEYVQAMES